ncbi:MAG: FtsK/SpoIIIE domain-containing protein [Luteolibacter sp.]|uniref:FtsK/SpoIIIE domain-containing protein n=1 Tax=Luteolibacter sp. TaxID=1962973 RepID=UPI003266A4C1
MQTATESIDLRSVGEKLLELKSGISGIISSEKDLIKNRAERMVVVRREMAQREEAGVEKLNRRLQELAAIRQHAIDREQERMSARNEWIHKAYHSSRAALANRAQGVKDRRIGQVQGSIMRNRQARQEELKLATEAHQAFQQQLAADRATRRDLRKTILADLRSYRLLLRKRLVGKRVSAPVEVQDNSSCNPEKLRVLLHEQLEVAKVTVDAVGALALAKLFRLVPLSLILAVIIVGSIWSAFRSGGGGMGSVMFYMGISVSVTLFIWELGWFQALGVISKAEGALAAAWMLEISADKQSAARLAAMAAEIKSENDAEGQNLSETFRESDSEWKARVNQGQKKLDQQFARIPETVGKQHARKLAKIEAAHEQSIAQAQADAHEQTRLVETSRTQVNTVIDSDVDGKIRDLTKPWNAGVLPVFESLASLQEQSLSNFPAWSHEVCENWTPPDEASPAIRIGRIEVDSAKLADGMPHDHRLALPEAGKFSVPFSLGFPDQGSLLIESDGSGGDSATLALNSTALRLLAAHPPGRASFVFIDPVGLGKDFAGLMHLADYEETLINHRIWTQSTQIEERLAELNDHIEKVIQMYLRNEYATITEYNQQAGTIAEKYRFVVIAGYPAAFSETSAKRLRSIASSGPRCGVHLLIQRDMRLPSPDTTLDEELRRACLRVTLKNGIFHLENAPHGAETVIFDAPPTHEDAITLVHRIGKASIDSNRVQVPFGHIAPPVDQRWTFDTTDELRVPIGRTGAKKLQMLAIGKGTRQHALVAGKTGSGKSTLFHVIITNLALWCSPEQVEFYLVDFKKGVEFKCYAAKHLPHARVIAIESDREFALSVLQRIDDELKRRGELFRKAGSQDMAGYKSTAGHEPLPRSLLLIDEFQEFFTEDDAVAQEASLLLDRIVRQGRAFGIHVILGSQTLGGAYTLARATLGQMVIRIALQCNETDAHLIMDDDNPAPRLLTRPGEGIYNDQAGAFAANSPFQIVWLPEQERDAVLDEVNQLAARESRLPPAPIIFEGNAPADIRDNFELAKLLRSHPSVRPVKAFAWLGAPNSIKGPTEAVFQRQSGSHLLVVGQSAERALSLLAISIVSLAAQYPSGQVEFVILDPHAYDNGANGYFQKLAFKLSCKILIGGPAEVPALMGELAAELERRGPSSGRDAPEVFLIVHDLQRFKLLRPGDEFMFSTDDDASAGPNPSQAFANLLNEGGPVGMHVLAATDTWNNVSRWIPRKLMAEFEMRVLFQMSANDSSNLIDSPAATTLGLHRALFHNEHYGTLETFRPYAMPDDGWLEEIAAFGESGQEISHTS